MLKLFRKHKWIVCNNSPAFLELYCEYTGDYVLIDKENKIRTKI